MDTLHIWIILCLMLEIFAQRNTDLNRFIRGENIALGKRTRQSSDYIEGHFTFSSNLSVDGNEDRDFSHNSCSSTDPDGLLPAWWSVDLGEDRILKKIIIFNRQGYTSRLLGAQVLGFTKNGTRIEIDSTANYNQDIINIDANIDRHLRNVTIVLGNSPNAIKIINICEVEIYAEENIALGKRTQQSSDYTEGHFTFSSNLSVDGNEDRDFSHNSCSSTNPDGPRPAWWSVDLGEDRILKKIIIFNRQGYTSRLYGARILGFTKNGAQIEIDSTANYNQDIITIDANVDSFFRNVTIILGNGQNTQNIINICEVEIYAVITCPIPPTIPENSDSSYIPGIAGNLTYNSSVKINCREGYKLQGAGAIRCTTEGMWNDTHFGTCSVITCPSPPMIPENSDPSYIPGIEGISTYDSSIKINCREGYKMQGTGAIRCTAEGTWSETHFGTCSVISCSIPPMIPENSDSNYIPGIAGNSTYNSSVTINCREGYKLEGTTIAAIRCTADGTWSEPSFGICAVITCPIPPKIPENSDSSYISGIAGNSTYNSSVNIICHEGYKLQGTRTIQCIAEGTWSETSFGICPAILCSTPPPVPSHSMLNWTDGIAGNLSYNSTLTITCNDRYELNGSGSIRCTEEGYWSGVNFGNCFETLKYGNPESSVGGVAGGATAAICVVILGVIVALILYRRRRRGPEDKIVDTTLNEIPSSSEGKKQTEQVILEDCIYAQPKKKSAQTKDPECDESKNVYMNSNDNSSDYYSFTPQTMTNKHSIRVEDLSSFFLSRKMEPSLYEEEYNKLPNGLIKSHEAALLQENRSKNRYKNIYPYDDTRVRLEIWDPSSENDYINASYVNGFKTFHAYIAAQGPTKGILNDFWRMIWQTKCSKIVMLTNLTEEGKHKCEKYWPDEGSVTFGDIVIRLVQCERLSDFTIRTLEMRKTNKKSEGGKSDTHQIKQFHFTAWPDRGVPRFASSLVHFRRKIRADETRPNSEGPMVIHCSAGIGRTGTFLALDYLVDQAEELGYINVVNCVETLRKQRVNLVQTAGQYIFLHEALLEALTCTTSALSTSEFPEAYRILCEMDNKTGKQRLDLEFEKLPMYVSDPGEDVYENAKNMENRHKNRYTNILPDKNHCPFLNVYVKGRDSYINAVFLPAYKENDIFIITQTPQENTIVDFWRMVYQFEVSSIVMLNTLSEMKEEERYWTEDEETLEILPFRITLESKTSNDICTNYTMLLNYQDERQRVRLSRATYWEDGKPVPKSPSVMLKQIDLIQNWQQETGSKPIIVHCMNGAERSGLFCVISALLERTKIEQDVAVEQIIKQMRSRRPQIIPNVDQFKFCYDAVLAYLNQFDTYSNFTGL